MRYYLAIPATWFHQRLSGSLRECWKRRSFGPVADLCRELQQAASTFIQRGTAGQTPPLTLRVAEGLPFRPETWRVLAGELMLFGAAELPELETPLATYAALLHQPLAEKRPDFPGIQQVIAGSRDLWFGTCYRPDHAGWNDRPDIARLADWLSAVDPQSWQADDLVELEPEERDDELAFAQEWFPSLAHLYQRCRAMDWILVCESL